MRSIFVVGDYEGYHRWAKAPEEVKFLRDKHRHIFYWKVEISVSHNDRELEFFMLKKEVKDFIKQNFNMDDLNSCEDQAFRILNFLNDKYPVRRISVSVSEDKENGAEISNG